MKDNKKQNLKEKGITLTALVVTIIILLILVGVTLTFALGENGIIGVAKKARKEQIIAETKEAIGLEITEAYTEAVIRKEGLEKKQVEDIVNKYGKLQEDGDTIITKKDGYEISLKEIYDGTLNENGSYSEKSKRLEEVEKRLEELESRPHLKIPLGAERSINVKEVVEKYIKDNSLNIDVSKIAWDSITKENFAIEVKSTLRGAKLHAEDYGSGHYDAIEVQPSWSYSYTKEAYLLNISVTEGVWRITGAGFENWWHEKGGTVTVTNSYLFL